MTSLLRHAKLSPLLLALGAASIPPAAQGAQSRREPCGESAGAACLQLSTGRSGHGRLVLAAEDTAGTGTPGAGEEKQDAADPPLRRESGGGLPGLIPADDDEPPKLGKNDGLLSLGDAKDEGPKLRGFVQQNTAYTYADPSHFSTAVFRADVGTSGKLGDNVKWKASVRGEFDPVYAWGDFYPEKVRHDQRFYGIIGETYIDTSVKGWDLRLGRQNIVWGEMVGLFFADVVTAKDLRQFILPSFDVIRIPQWAARGEYFFGDSHLELLWIPYTTFDRIGKPGSEFYPIRSPAPAGFTNVFRDEQLPARSLSNSNYGARISTLVKGWDLSAFHYRSMDTLATFYQEIDPVSALVIYTPRHDRIAQTGGTLSKDLGEASVLKAELVYTTGRSFNVTRLTQPNGLVQKDTLDYAVGLDYTLPDDARLNLQVFQRAYRNHDPDMTQERFETGATFLYNRKFLQKFEGEFLWIQSANRWENLIRPRITWKPESNWRFTAGVDIFNGPDTGVFGRYRDRDRVYVETRYDF